MLPASLVVRPLVGVTETPGGAAASSFWISPSAAAGMSAVSLDGLPRVTMNPSSFSICRSPAIWIASVLELSPGANVSVPPGSIPPSEVGGVRRLNAAAGHRKIDGRRPVEIARAADGEGE